jgi:hypothetical protein
MRPDSIAILLLEVELLEIIFTINSKRKLFCGGKTGDGSKDL